MDNFCVPPSAAWYTHAACTPDNGILYVAGNRSSIAYIPIHDNKGDALSTKVVHLHQHIKSFVCDIDWQTTRWFITFNEEHIVGVWNLDSGKTCRGHKAHFEYFKKQDLPMKRYATDSSGAAMCITKNRQVLSIDANAFVKYCVTSNTYSVLPENFITKRNTVSILKASPYNEDIVAAGHKNGLVLVVNIKSLAVTHKLRGHDTDIVSLEWMLLDKTVVITESDVIDNRVINTPGKNSDPIRRRKIREPPKPIVDADDMFDIYSYDYSGEEFGTITSSKKNADDLHAESFEEKIVNEQVENVNNENFDFVEACQTLREEITATKSDNQPNEQKEALSVNISDVRKTVKLPEHKSDTEVSLDSSNVSYSDTKKSVEEMSNRSTLGSSHGEVEIAEIQNKLDSLELNGKLAVAKEVAKDERQFYLASGAQEPVVTIWDINTGNVCKKIQLKTHSGKLAIPKAICTVAWVAPTKLVVSSPNGNLSRWLLKVNSEGKIIECIEEKDDYTDKAIVDITSISINEQESYLWTFSMHFQINCYKNSVKSTELVANYSTLPIGMYSMMESPHDPNRIAIAGNNKRISLLDLTTLKPSNIQMQAVTSKIQGKVLALSWHPNNENHLAFSTNEGRVGVFDISKSTSPPELMKNFCGKDMYRLCYAQSPESSKYALLACNNKELMLFPSHPKSHSSETYPSLKFPTGVSSVSANKKYVAVGTNDGELRILTLGLKEIFNVKISKKYVSDISWNVVNPEKLAVCSADEKIHIIENISNESDAPQFKDTGVLAGHEQGLTWVKWSNESEYLLVSTSYDRTVRVWDTKAEECIALKRYKSKMYCAIFMPSNENFVLCSGQSETLHIFDIRTHSMNEDKEKDKLSNGNVEWATIHQSNVQKLKAVEKKRIRNNEKKLQKQSQGGQNNTGSVGASNNLETVIPVNGRPLTPLQSNFTTVFYLTNKELNKCALACLHDLLNTENTDGASNAQENKYLNPKLFSTRQNVQVVLDKELKNHQNSNTDSIGHLLIPQINHNLKQEILDKIAAKKLTEQHIALAPSISYEFWKNCCKAFAFQCIEKHSTLLAMSYLLAIHDIDETIKVLCETHYYREAWIVAKLYREPEEEKTFQEISSKWIDHLEVQGHLEGAALIAFLVKQPKMALEIFEKRKSLTPEIEEIIKLLQEKVQKDEK